MNEIMRKRLKESLGKTILIFLNNNFRYEGKLTGSDERYIEMLDFKTNSYKVIAIKEVKDLEVKNEES